MVICVEISESIREEAKGKGTMVPMAKQWPKQTGSVFLQTNHSLSVTFLRDFQGVVLKLYQAPNFVTFHPTGSHLNLSLGISQSTSLPRTNYSMLDWNNNNPSQIAANRSQIIKTLREVVKRVVVEFRLLSSPLNPCGRANPDGVVEAVPVSFRPPSTNMDMVLSPKKRVTTLLVGENLVSFELPYNCPFHPDDLDELVEVERNEAKAQNNNVEIIYNVPRYTFLQRLQGWRMERRQRINGRFDMYYHHLRSRKVFRSVAEVVNFFMYEVYPDKPQKPPTDSNLAQFHFSGFKRERKEKGVTQLKRKNEEYERKKAKGKWVPIFFDNDNNNGDNYKKATDNEHRHIPMFDLNDDHQKEEEEDYYEDQNVMYDVVGDNYNQNHNDPKEKVEKFLAESYNNLMNLPNNNNNDNDDDDAKKSKSFSFDINEKICEEEEDDNDDANKQSIEEFLAEAFDNLMNYHKTQPTSLKGKEKISPSLEKPRRKKAKTYSPTSLSSFPNTPININPIPLENITKTVESMEVQKTSSITNVKQNHFDFIEVNRGNNFIFTDVCESSAAAAMKTKTSEGGGRGSSSASFHMDECDLINHIPESSDMFDLAMFLAKNRGGNNGGF